MSVRVGFTGTLKVGDLEITDAKDVTLETDAEEIETSRRTSDGWNEYVQGWKNWRVVFDVVYDNASVAVDNIRTAYMDGSEMSLSMLDVDGEGVTGTVIVTSFPKSEPLKDINTVSITLRGTGSFAVVNAVS